MKLQLPAFCPICDSQVNVLEDYLVQKRYCATLSQCPSCEWAGFLRPFWLQEAYSSAIAATDTGAVQRSLKISEMLSTLLVDHSLHNSRCLDYGAGPGLLVRIMRDKGYNFFWEDMHSDNIYSQGFEVGRAPGIEVITLFEVLEHLEFPLGVLLGLAKKHSPRLVVFSTALYCAPRPLRNWWYLSPETGQHVSFFTEQSLRYIASRLNASYYNYMGLHCFAFSAVSFPFSRSNDIFSRLRRKLARERAIKSLKPRTLNDYRLLLSRIDEK